MKFLQQPSDSYTGGHISPAVTVEALDSYGNVATSESSTVSVAIAYGPVGVPLQGTLQEQLVNGVATFSDLTIPTTGNYTLVATDGTLAGGLSSTIAIGGPATKVVFASQTLGSVVGGNIASPVTVYLETASGSVVAGDNSTVSLSLASGPTGGTLGGTLTVNAINDPRRRRWGCNKI